jgi:hypothetical protein
MKIARSADLDVQLASGIVQDGQIKLIQKDIFEVCKPSSVKLELTQVHPLNLVDPSNAEP